MKKKELIEIKLRLYKHQIDFLRESARKKGTYHKKMKRKTTWITVDRITRTLLDQYIYFIRPNIIDIIKTRRLKKYGKKT